MRKILSNSTNGTVPATTETTETTQISVMPNLRNIFANVFNVVPAVYIRDFIEDAPHTGSISASPDIILRPTSVAKIEQDSFTVASDS
jgi:serine protease